MTSLYFGPPQFCQYAIHGHIYVQRRGGFWEPEDELQRHARQNESGVVLIDCDTEAQFARVRELLDACGFIAGTDYGIYSVAGNEIARRVGHLRWIRVTLIPDKDASGAVRGVFSAVVDIDDDRRLRESLAERERHLELFTAHIPEAIAYVDHERRYRFVNETFARYRGVSREALVGKTVAEVLGAAAANLFAHLRELDARAAHAIVVMPIPGEGLGAAINDRLRRAASPRQ